MARRLNQIKRLDRTNSSTIENGFPQTAAGSTIEHLLDTAERLFAEEGLDGVSLNRVRKEAGARNASVMQYYFGSKRDLIVAIFERRTASINARRLSLLASVGERPDSSAVRAIVSAMVLPFAEQMSNGQGIRYYVRFVDQVYRDPRLEFESLLSGGFSSGLKRSIHLLEIHLTHLSRRDMRTRFNIVQGLIIHALADRERHQLAATRRLSPASPAAFNTLIIDLCVGALIMGNTDDTVAGPGTD